MFDLATMIGWEARRFHFMKQPKPLAKYLEPAPSPERKRDAGNRAVLALFKRHAAKNKKGTKDGTR